jgi:hypothetical protein
LGQHFARFISFLFSSLGKAERGKVRCKREFRLITSVVCITKNKEEHFISGHFFSLLDKFSGESVPVLALA